MEIRYTKIRHHMSLLPPYNRMSLLPPYNHMSLRHPINGEHLSPLRFLCVYRQKSTTHEVFSRKMSYNEKASYEFSPPYRWRASDWTRSFVCMCVYTAKKAPITGLFGGKCLIWGVIWVFATLQTTGIWLYSEFSVFGWFRLRGTCFLKSFSKLMSFWSSTFAILSGWSKFSTVSSSVIS